MKASLQWLCQLVPDLSATAREVADRLTFAGLEVEGIHPFGAASMECLVARVTKVESHPSKSGLRLVTVDRGAGHQTVVCGAPNVPEPGGLVVLAPLGAHLPSKNLTIDKRAVGGVDSEGMLCSESELGLGDASDGILVLPSGLAQPGATLAAALPESCDTILEIGITPNRPDGLGHVGLARELCALYKLPFHLPETQARGEGAPTREVVDVRVEAPDRCFHYGAAAAFDLLVGPSPLRVRYRLQALGVRSISNVVDVTNLVMLEFGHPMHAFDMDHVRDRCIVVRCALPGERLTTLDGVERTLTDDDLLICDGQGPLALAGVMGGALSEIRPTTRNVLFESAWFDPRGVRRTARRHGLHTESSHRFERGVDPGTVVQTLERAVGQTQILAGGRSARSFLHVWSGHVVDAPPEPFRSTIEFDTSRIETVLGVAIDPEEAIAILRRLGFECSGANDGQALEAAAAEPGRMWRVIVPTHRPDVQREIDLLEEVIRVVGMDAVPAELPSIVASRDVGGTEELARRARGAATSLGLSEAIGYAFTSQRLLETLHAPAPTVVLVNPLGEDHAVMRTTLLGGLLESVRDAQRHGERTVCQFTLGRVFLAPTPGDLPNGQLPREELRVAWVLAGFKTGWLEKPTAFDMWDMKGYVTTFGERLGAPMTIVARSPIGHLHPRGSAVVMRDGVVIGSVGPIHPDVADAVEVNGSVLVAEFSLEALAMRDAPHYKPIPRFPAVARDVALVVNESVPAGDVVSAIREAAGPLAEDVQIFDRFRGDHVPVGCLSLAFHVLYRAIDRTLTDAEVDAAHAHVVAATEKRFGATLRA